MSIVIDIAMQDPFLLLLGELSNLDWHIVCDL